MTEDQARAVVSNMIAIAGAAYAAKTAVLGLMSEMVRGIPSAAQPQRCLEILDSAHTVCIETLEATTRLLAEAYAASGVDLAELLRQWDVPKRQ